MFKSVKTHFAVLNLGLVLLASLILGTMSYILMGDALEKIQKNNLSYIAQSKAEHLASMVKSKQDLLKQIALGEVVQRYSQSFQDKLLQEYFTQFNNEFPVLSFVNQQGIEEIKVINGISHFDLDDITLSKLYEDVSWKPNFVFTTLTMPNNITRAPFIEFGFNRQTFFGDFQGIVIGRISLVKIFSEFRQFELGETGFLMILDETGNILSHPDQKLVSQPVEVSGIGAEQVLTQAVDMRTGVTRATIQGIDGFVAYAPIMDRDWIMLAILPYSEFIATPVKLRNIFIVVLCFILILGIVLSLYTAEAITRPVMKLARFSEQIAAGDLTQRVLINSSNEIGLLAKSFNLMVYYLHRSKQELESEAKIREGLINELEFKNDELERFTYTVSHDLKSPLVTVKGFIGLLREDIKIGDTERIERDIMQISNASDKMGSLLNDLLELSRIGRIADTAQTISLTELFEEVLTLIHVQIKRSNAKVLIQPDMPSVVADRQRLFEVAQNLVDNALKFKRTGCSPEILVTATAIKEQVVCCVSDNGIGIQPQYQDRIFGLFERLDQSIEGNGVGLALVRRIIEVHNGEITVKSKGDGHGAEFCFTLPAVRQETPL